MLNIILETFWLFLPAMAANMAPVFAARYRWLAGFDKPIDKHATFRGRRLLGDHKTVRGIIVGTAAGALVGLLQFLLFATTEWAASLSFLSYVTPLYATAVGAGLGFGALVGDAVKSFAKRQFDIMEGRSWPVFDQVDFILGAAFVMSFINPIPIAHIAIAIICIGVGSLVVSYVGVITGIKKSL